MKYPVLMLLSTTMLLTACNKEGGPSGRSKWIARVVEYRPAPGQFINTPLGNTAAAEGIIGGRNGCLSLGSFGGSVIFEFDHPVRNIAGTDFVIFGNAYEGNSEPGIVEVSPNGIDWYRLKGSEDDNAQTAPDYTITYVKPTRTDRAEAVVWTDNHGGNGAIEPVTFHQQSYWPLFLTSDPSELEFTGMRLPGNSSWTGEKFVQAAFEGGYADNWSADYDGTAGNDPDTRSSNKFDIDNAVDNAGNPVELTAVQRIRVYTAMNQQVGGGVGETSTEICGALSLSADL